MRSPRLLGRRGTTTVQVALTLPVWLTAAMMVVEYSWYVYQSATLDMALSAGCRAASIIDPGVADWRLPAMTARAEDETLDQLAALGEPCTGCTFDIYLQGIEPERQIVCELVQPARSGSALVFPYTELTGSRIALLEFQDS